MAFLEWFFTWFSAGASTVTDTLADMSKAIEDQRLEPVALVRDGAEGQGVVRELVPESQVSSFVCFDLTILPVAAL